MKVLTQKISRSHSLQFWLQVDDKFTKSTFVFRGENAAYQFVKAILKEHQYCKKVMKKHFNKTLIMSEEGEQFHLLDSRKTH